MDKSKTDFAVEFQMKLDLDIFQHFQLQAVDEKLESLQSLLNEKLRFLMRNESEIEIIERKLLNNKKFIAALAEEVKKAA